jgi:small multidrug resistance family-3 protein
MNASEMSLPAALSILLAAAFLEAGGDALVRSGLHSLGLRRVSLFLAGAVVLFAYGVVVNTPSWDFGRLLGIYIALFFVAAQVINYFAFHQKPALPIFVGGALIVSGGLVISLWKP